MTNGIIKRTRGRPVGSTKPKVVGEVSQVAIRREVLPLPKGCKGVIHYYVTSNVPLHNRSTALLTPSLVEVSEYIGAELEEVIDVLAKHKQPKTNGEKRKGTASCNRCNIDEVFLTDGIHYEEYV